MAEDVGLASHSKAEGPVNGLADCVFAVAYRIPPLVPTPFDVVEERSLAEGEPGVGDFSLPSQNKGIRHSAFLELPRFPAMALTASNHLRGVREGGLYQCKKDHNGGVQN